MVYVYMPEPLRPANILIPSSVFTLGEGSSLLGPILGFCFGAVLVIIVMSALLTYVCWRWRRGKVKLKRIRTETLSRKEENAENMYCKFVFGTYSMSTLQSMLISIEC